MEVRTVTVDIEKILDEVWQRFLADIEATKSLDYISDIEKRDMIDEDARACKYCLDVLRWCKLIDEAECADMQDRADAHADMVKDSI